MASNGDDHAHALDQFIRETVADQVQDYYRAIFHYQEALRYDSTSAFIHVALAQDYILLGNPGLADEFLNKALAINGNDAPALELKSLLMRGTGNLTGARESLRKLSALSPGKTEYLKQLLTLDLQLKKYDDADRDYQKIVDKEGESDFLARQVLSVYLSAQQQDRAIKYLERLIAKDSTDASLVYTLGAAYQLKGDTVRSEALLRKANRMEPFEPKYWAGLATIELNRQNYAEAVSLIDSSLKYAQNPPGALLNLKGVALNHLGRESEAVGALEAALNLDSTLVSALGTLAVIYDKTDSVAKVEDLYERAIRLSDSAAVYLNNLAYSFSERGIQLDRAKVLSTEALKREPKNASYLDTMGWIEFRLGQHDEAIRWLKRALKRSHDSADILEHLGDVYWDKGDHAKAKKFFSRALTKDPKNEPLREKLSR